MRKLAALQSYRKRVFFESLLSVRETPSGREVEPWDEDEVPLLWSLVGLESGLASVYPGTAKLYDPYDPRTRPWYTAAADAPGVVVGPPFVDEKSGEIVLSMSRRITAPDGARAGVAAIELTFGYVAKHLLDRPEPTIEETFLVDAKGDVLARTSGPPRPPGRGAVVLEPFPIADAREWLAARQGGTLETAWNGRGVVIGAYPLAELGWTFVAVADAVRLLGR
jgi:methyl-accepting chemotaxis protein